MSEGMKIPLLAMSAPPYWHCGRTIRNQSMLIIISLIPAICMAIYTWGWGAMRVMGLCVGISVFTQALCQKCMGREITIDNLTAVVTGILLSFLMPASSPWWIVALGAVIAIGLGKMAFGGLGANPLNTALVGWAILFVSFPMYMDANVMQLGVDYIDILNKIKYFSSAEVQRTDLLILFAGQQIGGLGSSQVGALFIGGIYLCLRGVIRWQVPMGFFLAVFIIGAIFNSFNSISDAPAFYHLFSGSIVLAGFYLATEMGTTPSRPIPLFIFGILCGVLTMLIRKYGAYTDGAPFAVLLCNLLTPYLDMIRPKPFGVR